MSTKGTISSALKVAPNANTPVGVALKYRWWKVPNIPPAKNTIVEKSTAVLATLMRNKPKRENKKAATTVANTSKKPSTQRCTTHQRQYSAIAICV